MLKKYDRYMIYYWQQTDMTLQWKSKIKISSERGSLVFPNTSLGLERLHATSLGSTRSEILVLQLKVQDFKKIWRGK